MSNPALAWLIAALATMVSIFLGMALRARSGAERAAAEELEQARERVGALEAQVGKRESKNDKRSEELQELRRKLDKARKRAAQAKDELAPSSERIRELEALVAKRDDELRGLRSERAVVPEAAAPIVAAAALAAETDAHAEAAQRESVRVRAANAEAKLAANEKALAEAQSQLERLRVRVRNQDMLYASLRGELDVKNDRLKQQRETLERMQALKVALVDAPLVEASAMAAADVPGAGPVAAIDTELDPSPNEV